MSHIHSQWLHIIKSLQKLRLGHATGALSSFLVMRNWSFRSDQWGISPYNVDTSFRKVTRRNKNVTVRPFTKSSMLQLQETIKGWRKELVLRSDGKVDLFTFKMKTSILWTVSDIFLMIFVFGNLVLDQTISLNWYFSFFTWPFLLENVLIL